MNYAGMFKRSWAFNLPNNYIIWAAVSPLYRWGNGGRARSFAGISRVDQCSLLRRSQNWDLGPLKATEF